MEVVSFLPQILCIASAYKRTFIWTLWAPYKHAEALQRESRESSIASFLFITSTTTCMLRMRRVVAQTEHAQ